MMNIALLINGARYLDKIIKCKCIMILREKFDIKPVKGTVLIRDVENPLIVAEQDERIIERPEGAAYEEQNEGSGTIVRLAQTIRYGEVAEVSDEDKNDYKASFKVGDYVFYQSHAATLIPVGPQDTLVRIPVPSILAKVTQV